MIGVLTQDVESHCPFGAKAAIMTDPPRKKQA
jgi:hypothetical protein